MGIKCHIKKVNLKEKNNTKREKLYGEYYSLLLKSTKLNYIKTTIKICCIKLCYRTSINNIVDYLVQQLTDQKNISETPKIDPSMCEASM